MTNRRTQIENRLAATTDRTPAQDRIVQYAAERAAAVARTAEIDRRWDAEQN